MNAISKLLIFGSAVAPTLATAHNGHGMPSVMHFHASDAWGFAMLAAVAVGVFWLARKK
jgi:hypothetical protein